MDELKPMTADLRNVVRSEPQQEADAVQAIDPDLGDPLSLRPSKSLKSELDALELIPPIHRYAAFPICYRYVGLHKRCGIFDELIDEWWGRMAQSKSPEEKLSCSRVIEALCEAKGLNKHQVGARLSQENLARVDARRRERAKAEAAAEEAAALDRWR